MMYGAISKRGKSDLAVIEENLNTDLYCQRVEHNPYHSYMKSMGNNWAVLCCNMIMLQFIILQRARIFSKLECFPLRLASHKPRFFIENFGTVLAKKVYENGNKQYYSLKSLETLI